jgi:NhaA family Na+:H+ antiporter
MPPKTHPHPSTFRGFLRSEAAGGLALMFSAALALIVANSPLNSDYEAALAARIGPLSALHWINDGLMSLFFLLVGLEIKRELLDGHLRHWSARILPGLGALGGMIVPAAIYATFNFDSPTRLHGWAIPAATDIAFALGVLALLGPRAPASLKVFLTALAILDDLGAIAIIGVAYTDKISAPWLLAAGATLLCLLSLNRFGVRRLLPYLALGVALWLFVLYSGVHATLAGVLLAAATPLRSNGPDEGERSPLHRLESALQPYVAFLILPLFGFANAGLSFDAAFSADATPVAIGVAVGLFLGKQLGVFGAVALAIRTGLAAKPRGANWSQIHGVAVLCGVGFTMSLFIGEIAFDGDRGLVAQVKLGVLAGSLASIVAGVLLLRRGGDKPQQLISPCSP